MRIMNTTYTAGNNQRLLKRLELRLIRYHEMLYDHIQGNNTRAHFKEELEEAIKLTDLKIKAIEAIDSEAKGD